MQSRGMFRVFRPRRQKGGLGVDRNDGWCADSQFVGCQLADPLLMAGSRFFFFCRSIFCGHDPPGNDSVQALRQTDFASSSAFPACRYSSRTTSVQCCNAAAYFRRSRFSKSFIRFLSPC